MWRIFGERAREYNIKLTKNLLCNLTMVSESKEGISIWILLERGRELDDQGDKMEQSINMIDS